MLKYVFTIFALTAAIPLHAAESQPEETVHSARQQLRKQLVDLSGCRPEKPSAYRLKKFNYLDCARAYQLAGGDKRKLYCLVATQLRIAETLLESRDEASRTSGIGVLKQVQSGCILHVKDPKLAVLVADAWVLPSLSLCPTGEGNPLRSEYLLGLAVASANQAKQFDDAIRFAEILRRTARTRGTSDAATLQIGTAMERLGRFEDAIRELEKIQRREGMGSVKNHIQDLRKRASEARSN